MMETMYARQGSGSAILTGRTPLRARMVTTVGPMQEGEVTVAAALKTAGYETGHFGKWGLGRDGTHPLKVGFDEVIWNKNYFDLAAAFFRRRQRQTGRAAGQEKNLAVQCPDKIQTMRKDLGKWMESVRASFAGNDCIR